MFPNSPADLRLIALGGTVRAGGDGIRTTLGASFRRGDGVIESCQNLRLRRDCEPCDAFFQTFPCADKDGTEPIEGL